MPQERRSASIEACRLLIPHLHNRLRQVGEAKLFVSPPLVLHERVELTRDDLIVLDCVRQSGRAYLRQGGARPRISMGLLGMGRTSVRIVWRLGSADGRSKAAGVWVSGTHAADWPLAHSN